MRVECGISNGENCQALTSWNGKPQRCEMPQDYTPCPLVVAVVYGDRSWAQAVAEYREIIARTAQPKL